MSDGTRLEKIGSAPALLGAGAFSVSSRPSFVWEVFLPLCGCAEIMRKCKIMDGHSQKNVVK